MLTLILLDVQSFVDDQADLPRALARGHKTHLHLSSGFRPSLFTGESPKRRENAPLQGRQEAAATALEVQQPIFPAASWRPLQASVRPISGFYTPL